MVFRYEEMSASAFSSVMSVRSGKPIQRQQSDSCGHSNQEVPTQCTDDIIRRNLCQKSQKDQANDLIQQGVTKSKAKFPVVSCPFHQDENDEADEEEHYRQDKLGDLVQEKETKQNFTDGEADEEPLKKDEEEQEDNRMREAKEDSWMKEEVEMEEDDSDGNADENQKEEIEEVEQEEGGNWKEEKGKQEQEKVMKTGTEKADDGKPTVLEKQAGTKGAESAQNLAEDSLLIRNDVKEANRKKDNSLWREVVDMTKAQKMHQDKSLFAGRTGESILQNSSFKVKSTANETSGKDGAEKGQADQRGTNGQATSRPGRASCSSGRAQKFTGEDDDDDDGMKRGPSRLGEKRLDCDRQAPPKKNTTKKGTSNGSPSPSPKPTIAANSRQHPGTFNNELGLHQQMQQMSIGSDENQANTGPAGDFKRRNYQVFVDNFGSSPLPEKPIPRTSHNLDTVERFYNDNGVQVPHEMHGGVLSVPREVHEGNTDSVPREALIVGTVSARGNLQTADGLDFMAVDPEAEVVPKVVHGEPRNLLAYADRLQEEQHISSTELQGRHDGVILDEELKIVHGQYKENERYTKLQVLGRGSFGDAYLIQDKTAGKKVVGKRVIMEKFACSEAVLWCNLEHPNIVAFLGLVRTDDTVMFLSEYHESCQTLQELLKDSILGQGRALHLIEQLFNALVYLNTKSIVHKDIKPDNILVLNDHIWLIDFGLAMRLTAPQHTDETLKGTECYMAPEIAGSESYDLRVDVWSALCTFMCLISGHPPWAQRFKGVGLKIYIIASREAPLQDIPEKADPRVRQFIEWGLQKDFNNRPTAAQVLQYLQGKFPCDIVHELYNTLAISVEPKSQPEPMAVAVSIPDVLAGPLTPWTPRGPQEDKFHPFTPPESDRGIKRPAPNLSLSFCFLPEDVKQSPENTATAEMESASEDQPQSCSAEMEVEEEDMYGPPMDNDGPEIFNEGAFSGHASPAVNNSALEVDRAADDSFSQLFTGRQTNALDQQAVDPQVNSVGGAQQNSQAALSFIQDEAKGDVLNVKNLDDLEESFELGDSMTELGSSEFNNSLCTAYANVWEASKIPSGEGAAHQDEPDQGAAAGIEAMTSGFDSNSPRDSAEEGKGQLVNCPAEKVTRTDDIPSGIIVRIYVDDIEPLQLRVPPDFTVRQLAKQIIPNCVNSKIVTKSFTLRMKDSGEAIEQQHTFGCGEHELVAVEAADGGDWLWRVN